MQSHTQFIQFSLCSNGEILLHQWIVGGQVNYAIKVDSSKNAKSPN